MAVMRGCYCLLVIAALGCGDDGASAVDAGAIDGSALPAIDAAAIDAGAAVDPLVGIGTATLISDAFQFVEGPVWRPGTGVLLFSE